MTGKQPSFLGIGAQHAGTSWLHRNLARHPEVWLPAAKELHYFDAMRPGADSYDPPLHRRLRKFVHKRNRTNSLLFLGNTLILRARLRSTLRYILGQRNDRWYVRLFPKDRVSGEITPEYMSIPPKVIEEVHGLNPEMKIILLLRNPIDRTWSHARRVLRRQPEVSKEESLRLTLLRGGLLRSDYVSAVTNWRRVFGNDRLFIGFYDDLVKSPRDLFRSILQFLGVSCDDRFIPSDIDKAHNTGPKRDLPEHIAAELAATYRDQLRELDALVGGHASAWRAAAEEMMVPQQT
jgi:hypothetical protein